MSSRQEVNYGAEKFIGKNGAAERLSEGKDSTKKGPGFGNQKEQLLQTSIIREGGHFVQYWGGDWEKKGALRRGSIERE